jgi:hypothetical protein
MEPFMGRFTPKAKKLTKQKGHGEAKRLLEGDESVQFR